MAISWVFTSLYLLSMINKSIFPELLHSGNRPILIFLFIDFISSASASMICDSSISMIDSYIMCVNC